MKYKIYVQHKHLVHFNNLPLQHGVNISKCCVIWRNSRNKNNTEGKKPTIISAFTSFMILNLPENKLNIVVLILSIKCTKQLYHFKTKEFETHKKTDIIS